MGGYTHAVEVRLAERETPEIRSLSGGVLTTPKARRRDRRHGKESGVASLSIPAAQAHSRSRLFISREFPVAARKALPGAASST